ncbi:hypothetical protein BaRGS_00016904 [Batillaria attramentaria]|uniref:Metalloendopeptidase n=1 Tax=Batillaria attramentaria TaxID=370345 RepID=A0ABD0KXI1_9CAEN
MKVFFVLLCIGLALARPEIWDDEALQITVEDARYFEGDIELPKFRNAIRYSSGKWSSGVVPYVISSSYPSSTRSIILQAMLEMESNTKHGSTYCIRFVPRTTEQNYIYIHRGSGCHSKIGHQGGQQEVSIGTGCERKGTIMHELNHALGFWHEQNRYDRDTYVTVHTSNIDSIHQHDFAKHTTHDMNTLGSPYDFGSIMHYGAYTFARDKSQPALSPKPGKANGVTMGQRLAMSTHDVERIQALYGCTRDTSHITRPSTTQDVVNCNFDSGLCNLAQDHADNFDWSRRSGHTPTSNTGPNADHTNSAGSYIYAEANGHHNNRARLLTPTAPAGQYCIDFFLFQHGSQEGSFQILASGSRIREQAVKTIAGSQAAEWKHYRINLNVPASFRAILQANIGSGNLADVAIDDFSFYHGRCL